jgi:hypothetical protein
MACIALDSHWGGYMKIISYGGKVSMGRCNVPTIVEERQLHPQQAQVQNWAWAIALTVVLAVAWEVVRLRRQALKEERVTAGLKLKPGWGVRWKPGRRVTGPAQA